MLKVRTELKPKKTQKNNFLGDQWNVYFTFQLQCECEWIFQQQDFIFTAENQI